MNPTDTPKEILRYKYYHSKCYTALGHNDARSKLCFSNIMIVEEQKKVTAIFDEAMVNEILKTAAIHKLYLLCCVPTLYKSCHLDQHTIDCTIRKFH